MFHLQEKKFNNLFKIYLKTFLLVEKVEGEMVPKAEGSSVKGSSQQSWTSAPKVKGGCPLKTL